MRIALFAIGRLGRAPEAALAKDYAQRAAAAGRSLGFTGVEVVEIEARKAGKAAEAEALVGQLPTQLGDVGRRRGPVFAGHERQARQGGQDEG